MNFLSVFEERISGVFGSASQAAAPFSFKKLAKKAASEMEKETYVINGVDTAPALFTVLVAQDDDAAMRPLYLHLTEETSLFLEAHAQRRGYTFVGKPLVRFMVDPSLKHGKFSVFAENVDVRTLTRLREEEARYAGEAPAAAAPLSPAAGIVAGAQAPLVDLDAQSPDAGLTSMPVDMAMEVIEDAYAHEHAAQAPAAPMAPVPGAPAVPAQGAVPLQPAVPHRAATPRAMTTPVTPVPPAVNVPLVNPRADYLQQVSHASADVRRAQQAEEQGAHQLAAPPAHQAIAAVPAAMAQTPVAPGTPMPQVPGAPASPMAPAAEPSVPPTQLRHVPLVGMRQPSSGPGWGAPLLIDRQTGQTYQCVQDVCVIGRERTTGGIVLHDPNVSRRHAQLTRRGNYWTITDLNSTNGTLVNDVDVDECALRDGDLITLGLTNLEFREA